MESLTVFNAFEKEKNTNEPQQLFNFIKSGLETLFAHVCAHPYLW